MFIEVIVVANILSIVPNLPAFRKRNPPEQVGLLPFELARMLVSSNHVICIIVNANHSAMGAAAVLRVIDCRARVLIPQSPERKRIGNQIDAAMIFARADFVNSSRTTIHG
jgi:hypothetical protein